MSPKPKIDQADAQIRLIDAHLARAVLRAPFEALVVSGDLTQSIGAAVRRGDVLFTLAPLDDYRVILNVDESQIGEIHAGFVGSLLVLSLPDEPFSFQVVRITPIAVAKDGLNTFRVEARLTETSPRLRPGMEGVGKISVDERRVVWIWTRSLLDWFHRTLWQWVG